MLEDDRSSSPLDDAISKSLGDMYGNLSRRSFLSAVTRKLIGLTNVVVAAQVMPFLAPLAKAAPQYAVDERCGLHGYVCGPGNCQGGVVGHKWVQCCVADRDSCPSLYSCCQYTDYCGPEPLEYSGCDGVPPSGTSWCGPPPNRSYRCTRIVCSYQPSQMYVKEQDCKAACMSTHQATYCADDPLL
jgi:hypothetical protein